MAEPNQKLIATINLLREENIVIAERALKQGEGTEEGIKNLGKTMGELLAEIRGDRLQQEEDRREKKNKEKSGAVASAVPSVSLPTEAIGGILLGIPSLILGFVTGFATQFAKIALTPFRLILRPVTNLVEKITSRFSQNVNRLVGERFDKITRFVNVMLADFTARFNLATEGFRKNSARIFKNLSNAFQQGINGINGVARSASGQFRQLNLIERGVKAFGSSLKEIKDSWNGVKEVFKNLTRPFTTLSNNAKEGFSIFDKAVDVFKNTFKFLASIGPAVGRFGAAIGRFVAFPITIIMGIVDGVTGLMDGLKAQEGGNLFQKALGAITGAIGGILKGISAIPLDLIKSAVSWIAKFFGGEDNPITKFLDSFSFEGLFQTAIDGVQDFIRKPGEYISNWVTSAKQALNNAFETLSSMSIGEIITAIPRSIFNSFTSMISWVTGKLGFEELSEFFADFDPYSLLSKIIDTVISIPKKAVAYITDLFTQEDPVAAFAEDVSIFVQNVKDFFLGLIPSMEDIKAIATKGLSAVKNFFSAEEEQATPPPAPQPVSYEAPPLVEGEIPTAPPVELTENQVKAKRLANRADQLKGEIMKDPENEDLKREFKLLISEIRRSKDPGLVSRKIEREKELTTRPTLERPPLTAAEFQAANINQVNRENAEAKEQRQMTAVNFAPVTQSTVVQNDQKTDIVMSPNVPPVDTLDPSWS